ncbi:beta-glucoside-specific PTS transporter subunit IIABC [Priestia aryabhattai]|uniref:beta-glucoside-specific PTS transporter subunit IIABC n=1 Tax=Priestia aryabhattai TaxID=412384 RepID=UPI0018747765|nr:beta-glucoside-specific PTS transporter subunit IIABC [Priestia aryabhattai]MBE5102318.1 PTS glucose transporter subunit IIA [Priestia aryabhattai]
MSKKYENLAKDIVQKIGGNENVSVVHHCQTRLRFKLYDNTKADLDAISKLDGVVKALINGGMFQVVIGMHVAEVYEEIIKFIDIKGDDEEGTHVQEKNSSLFRRGLDGFTAFISSVFAPIIPALAGAGMVKALLAVLVSFGLVATDNQTYVIINMFGDATFVFLPMLLAYTTAQKLKCNPVLAVAVAGIMCHPTWSGLVDAQQSVSLFDIIPLSLVNYSFSVIPIILVILVQAKLEKWLNKIVAESLKLVIVPMLVFLIMGTLALSILGPMGNFVGQGLSIAFSWLSVNVSWAPPLVIGATFPLLVMFGLHHAIAPIGIMQLAQMGYDSIWGPGVLTSNIAIGTATLILGLSAKNAKTKQIGTSTGITGLMGITEPALYGIIIPKKYPLIAALIGGAAGGLFAGITATRRFATGSSGIPALVMYLGDNTMQYLYQIIIASIISLVITAVLTFILMRRFEKKEETTEIKKTIEVENSNVSSPLKGTAIALSEVKDEVFSSEALGKGVAIEPSEGKAVAPFNGVVTTLFPTKHALGITSDDGVEVLVHIGINTVELNGKYFEAHVKQGDKVQKGQILITFDLENLRKEGYVTQVPIVVTNTQNYSDVLNKSNGKINYNDELLALKA